MIKFQFSLAWIIDTQLFVRYDFFFFLRKTPMYQKLYIFQVYVDTNKIHLTATTTIQWNPLPPNWKKKKKSKTTKSGPKFEHEIKENS